MTPTKADFVAVLEVVHAGRLLNTQQFSIMVAALQRAAGMPDQEAAPTKTEISLLPAVLAKAEEGCDLLREMRDMMRRRDNPHVRAKLVSMVTGATP